MSTSPKRSCAFGTRCETASRATYAKLTPWQRVQVARHADGHMPSYIDRLITDYMPLAGDRAFGDAAVVGGGRLKRPGCRRAGAAEGRRHRFTHQQFRHGAAGGLSQGATPDEARRPRFRFAGGHPGRHAGRLSSGLDAEAVSRGDRQLDRYLFCRSGFPLVSVVIGEGGSGGALVSRLGRPRLHAGELVYSVITGRLRLDPVARQRQRGKPPRP